MKKNNQKVLWIIAAAVILLFSCASAPEPAAPAAEEPAAEKAAPAVSFAMEKAQADDAMDKAKSIKADIAVPSDYKAAAALYNEAELLESAPESGAAAAEKYLEAETSFLSAYEKAYEKRETALKELDLARDDIKRLETESEELESLRESGGTQ